MPPAAAQIEDSINQVLADQEFYPNVTGISVNPVCTEFNVMLSSRELSLYENVLHMSLCIVGDRFQLYQGKRPGSQEAAFYLFFKAASKPHW